MLCGQLEILPSLQLAQAHFKILDWGGLSFDGQSGGL